MAAAVLAASMVCVPLVITPLAHADTPVCQLPGGATGDMTPCNNCLNALGNPDLIPQIAFDCGSPGAVNPTGGKPHCMVGVIHTGQPNCYGSLHVDGSVTN